MTGYVALLRAINVGGTGKLPMTELKAMCEQAGFEKVPPISPAAMWSSRAIAPRLR